MDGVFVLALRPGCSEPSPKCSEPFAGCSEPSPGFLSSFARPVHGNTPVRSATGLGTVDQPSLLENPGGMGRIGLDGVPDIPDR